MSRVSRTSASILRGCYEETSPVEFWLNLHQTITFSFHRLSVFRRLDVVPSRRRDYAAVISTFLAVDSSMFTPPPVRHRSIVISTSVCCPHAYLRNRTSELRQIFYACYLWLWLGPHLAALQYVIHFRF